VLQEALKRILKQKPHPYEIYNKGYEVIKSHISHVRSGSHILRIFNLCQRGNHQNINLKIPGETTNPLGLSCICFKSNYMLC